MGLLLYFGGHSHSHAHHLQQTETNISMPTQSASLINSSHSVPNSTTDDDGELQPLVHRSSQILVEHGKHHDTNINVRAAFVHVLGRFLYVFLVA